MCWSGEASAALAAAGLASTAYLAVRKKESKYLLVPLAYFSLMELLQAITYIYIGSCSLPINQVLTLLGYIHIAFQPFFINMVSMYFVPERVREKISWFVYGLSFIGTVLMIIKMYPFIWAGTCAVGTTAMCGQNLCSVHGSWHIAWNVPVNAINWLYFFGYTFPAFILPVLYGSWRMTLYHALIGPSLAFMLTNNLNEWPAVWCLFSIGLLLIVIKSPIRKILHVKKWYFWKYPGWSSIDNQDAGKEQKIKEKTQNTSDEVGG